MTYSAADSLVYAAKGNKTQDFYRYDPSSDSWAQRRAVPLGSTNRKPHKGCCGVADGDSFVYMTKGNGTSEFWRYSIPRDTWEQLRDVGAGSPSAIRYRADMAYVNRGGNRSLYLLEGRRGEFLRYDIASDSWTAMPDAPGPGWDDGSFLVSGGDSVIYAHKARYHELRTFDVASEQWNSGTLSGMPVENPITGRSRRTGPGGNAAWAGDGFYALKGRNTQDLWRYFVG